MRQGAQLLSSKSVPALKGPALWARVTGLSPAVPPALIWHRFCSMSSQPQPRFAKGADVDSLSETVTSLIKSQSSRGRWVLAKDGEALERSFKFKTFGKTWDFMTAVSLHCKLKNHHPEWSNVYNTTFIRWTTHNPQGLSGLDVTLAKICDSLAHDFGEIAEEQTEPLANTETAGSSCAMGELADKAVSSAGNCCGQK